MEITVEVVERFHEKWVLNKENGCWEWTAMTGGTMGYGYMKIPNTRKQIAAHRLSYLIHYGELPEGKEICHSCDNPRCVKPSHLFPGTSQENHADMKAKNRHLNGEKNSVAKLTEDQVRHIHRLHEEGLSQGKIAKSFGVCQMTVNRIIHGQRWVHIFNEINRGAK